MLKVYCTLKKKMEFWMKSKSMEICRRHVNFFLALFSSFLLFLLRQRWELFYLFIHMPWSIESKNDFSVAKYSFPLKCIKLRSQIYLINQFRFNYCRTCRKFAFRLVKYLFTLRHIIRTRYLFIIFLKF